MRRATARTVIGALFCLPLLAGCGGDDPDDVVASDPTPTGVDCDYPADGTSPARPVEPPSGRATETGQVPLTVETSVGELVGVLDAGSAPCTVHNLVSLAQQGWYDDTVCHRLTTQGIFVLQCGDASPDPVGTGGPGYTIPDELSGEETYPAGTLAMAKTAMPDSGGSQFFIVYDDTQLPPDYTVFGSLDEDSTAVVRELAQEGVEGGAADGPPATEVRISSVTTG